MEGVVDFLIVAAVVFAALFVLAVLTRELFNYARSRAVERAVKRSHAAASHGDSAMAHDALAVGRTAGVATHASSESSAASGAGESSSGSWGESSDGGHESSASGGESGGGDYGGGGDFGGGGGGGSWS